MEGTIDLNDIEPGAIILLKEQEEFAIPTREKIHIHGPIFKQLLTIEEQELFEKMGIPKEATKIISQCNEDGEVEQVFYFMNDEWCQL